MNDLEVTDEMRARLLVTVTGEDAEFIRRVVAENARLREALEAAKEPATWSVRGFASEETWSVRDLNGRLVPAYQAHRDLELLRAALSQLSEEGE